MPFTQTRDLNIHYEATGTGDTTLLLVHGYFASWRWWQPVFDRLPPGYRAYAPDLRGCGDTWRPSEGYTIEYLSNDLRGFAAALDLPRFHLVGHSLGGAAALQFALDYPKMVQTLTLVAPAPAEGMPILPRGNRHPSWVLHLFKLQRDTSLGTLDATYRLLRTLGANRVLLRQGLIHATPTLPHEGNDEFEALVDDAARMAPEAMVGYIRALATWNVQAELEKLYLPVLILWGKRDILVSQAALKRTVKGLSQGQLITWADVGHSPQLEQPDRFAHLLTRFVDEHSERDTHDRISIVAGPDERSWLERLWHRVSNHLPHPSSVTAL